MELSEEIAERKQVLKKKVFYPQLESLRGIAAFWVLLLHVDWTFPGRDFFIIRNGYLMVDLFFMLSGFVITSNYATKIKDGKDFKNFFILRFFRLFPLHLLMLMGFVAAYFLVAVSKHEAIGQIFKEYSLPVVCNLLFIHSLGIFNNVNIFNTASWSISVEFYVYLLFALQIIAVGRNYFVNVILIVVAGALLVSMKDQLNLAGDFASFLRGIVGFNIGCLLTAFTNRVSNLNFLGPVGALIAVIFLGFKPAYSMLDFLVYVPFVILILGSLSDDDNYYQKFLKHKVIFKLGTWSYSIYMVHGLIMYCFKFGLNRMHYQLTANTDAIFKVGGWFSILLVIVFVGLVLLTSSFTFKYIEDRFRIKGKNLIKRDS